MKKKDGPIALSEKSFDSFVSKVERPYHVRQMLLAELWLIERVDPKTKKTQLLIPKDRIWHFLRLPGAVQFCRSVLVADRYALLNELARLAYRSDDVDFPGLLALFFCFESNMVSSKVDRLCLFRSRTS
jgi:hypothetical protein